ncbi:hypothetical protein [Catenuloplanes nepalensis]|nr:hypothetical protein [Catenuloplanes nepalensis]
MPSNALAAAAAEPAKGQEVCKLSDQVLSELSGIAAYDDGYFVINDGSDNPAEATKVFYLDGKCKLQGKRTMEYPGDPADTEDMVLSPDGKTLWVGDVGDNEGKRATIGLFKIDLTAESPEPVYYPLRYPGDNAPNAEALLVNGDGTPIVVTKEAAIAHLWVPSAPLEKTADGIELKQAGEWKIPLTETSTWLGVPGRLAVTGGAVAPGGAKVALRTYADAFEWDVQNGDVIAAVTSGEPRITGLPDESFGEAISYAADGTSFVTVSEVSPGQTFAKDTPKLLKYAPAHNAVQADTGDGDGQGDNRALWERVSLGQITAGIVSVGIVGLLMLAGGIAGIVMFRRRNPVPDEEETPARSASAAGSGDGDSPDQSGGFGAESSGANRREPAAAGAVYGAGGAARSAGVYGGGPGGMNGGGSGAVQRGGGVYGGGPAGMNGGGSGAVYGAGGAGAGQGGGKAGVSKAGGVYGGGPAGMNGGGSGAVYGAGGDGRGSGRAPGGPGGSGPAAPGQGPRGGPAAPGQGPRGGPAAPGQGPRGGPAAPGQGPRGGPAAPGQGPRGGGPRGGGRAPQDPQQSGGVYGGGPAGMNGGGSGAVYGAGGQGGGRGPGDGGRGPVGPGGGPRGGGQGGPGGPGGSRGGGQGGPGGPGGSRGGGQGGPGGPGGSRGGGQGGPGGPRGGGPNGAGPGDGGPRGPQQSGGTPQQSGGNPQAGRGAQQGARGPRDGGRGPQDGRNPQEGGGRPPRQGGNGVYGGGPGGMNGGGSGAVYGGGDGERSGGHDRRDDQRGGYPQNPPYDDRRR